MSGVKNRKLIQALKYAKVTAFVLALSSTGVLVQGSDWVYADTPADSEGGSENSSGSGGGNEAGASQESDASADANSDPNGDAGATGTGSGEAGASGTSGGKTAEAEVQTDTEANAAKNGNEYSADAEANANIGDPNETPGLTAVAEAIFGGGTNEASASTEKNGNTVTSAKSVLGQEATAFCNGGCEQSKEKVGKKKTVAIAITGDHMSFALTTKKKSVAKSGAISSFSKRQARYGGSAFVEAWAKATGNYARSAANAEAKAYSGRRGDGTSNNEWMANVVKMQKQWTYNKRRKMKPFAWAKSNSYAKACVGTGCRPPAPREVRRRDDCEWVYRNKQGLFIIPRCEWPRQTERVPAVVETNG